MALEALGEALLRGEVTPVMDALEGQTDVISRCNHAYLSLEMELYRACIRECDGVIKAYPTCLRAYHLKGLAYQRMGRPRDAQRSWKAGVVAGKSGQCDFWVLKELAKLASEAVEPNGDHMVRVRNH